MALQPGSKITQSIRLVRMLGEGGMGVVWLADHEALRTSVVVKFVRSAYAGDRNAVERFAREAASAARVRSPHVVQIFDHGVTDDATPFIVMELLDGRDLGHLLDERVRLEPAQVVVIVTQVAKALQRAHEQGVVHRDIKPENIFLTDLGTDEIFVKLLDFGIAKADGLAADQLTKSGITIGTPRYMSPELLLSAKEADAHADVWALAVVAFEMLTGQQPFAASTIAGVALEILKPARTSARAFVPSLPVTLDAWCAKAFALDRDARFQSARELADALRRALGFEATPTATLRFDAACKGPKRTNAVSVRPRDETVDSVRQWGALASSIPDGSARVSNTLLAIDAPRVPPPPPLRRLETLAGSSAPTIGSSSRTLASRLVGIGVTFAVLSTVALLATFLVTRSTEPPRARALASPDRSPPAPERRSSPSSARAATSPASESAPSLPSASSSASTGTNTTTSIASSATTERASPRASRPALKDYDDVE